MFGERLKSERQRLGMNQDNFAAIGGVKKRAQISYEQNERSPDAEYLRALGAVGVDVQYVLTGEQSSYALTQDEKELLSGYRGLDIRGKAGVLGMIDGMSTPPTTAPAQGKTHVEIHGRVRQQVTGDINAPQTFHSGGTKKKKPPVQE